MPDRISDVIDPAYLIPVYISHDWAAPSNAAIDMFAATGLPIAGEGNNINLDSHVHLWEGPGDEDDYACLYITAAGAAAYKDMDANACDWASRPAKGQTAYIIGITFVK